MRILVALSGGVDSSVAAAQLCDEGHEVVGATMKLWGGRTDSGCCSLSDVEDARRVAARLGIDHFVFNFTDEFEARVVGPYVAAHAAGLTPNPCIECNRHLKFSSFVERAKRLGFDAVATGHHARVERDPAGRPRLLRGKDRAKDQSYVLSCLTRAELEVLVLPIGELTKADVRQLAAKAGLLTASKPDSQDLCFLGGAGTSARKAFLANRIELHAAEVVDQATGAVVGRVPAVELVTLGQRRGLGVATGERRFAVTVDVERRRVELGPPSALSVTGVRLSERTWTAEPLASGALAAAQASAHGRSFPVRLTPGGLAFESPRRAVAPGQTVALYRDEAVVGSGIVVAGP